MPKDRKQRVQASERFREHKKCQLDQHQSRQHLPDLQKLVPQNIKARACRRRCRNLGRGRLCHVSHLMRPCLQRCR
ncbi:MAG: DUF3734 domain-containing protein [Shimia sp.]|uniref:DUF3734 domain-containing protein n=1 Tax=Shimia sp. TaxID=1954381 RepID=UPI0040596A1D